MKTFLLKLLFISVLFSFVLASCKQDEPESSVYITVLPPEATSEHGYQLNDIEVCKLEFTRSNGFSFFQNVGLNSRISFENLQNDNCFACAYGYDKFGTPIAVSIARNFYLDNDSSVSQSLQLEWHETGKEEDQFCMIVFDSDGGTEIADQRVKSGELVSVPDDPVKVGHKFLGWYWDSSRNYEFDFTSAVSWSITLHAKWEEKSPTISFYVSATGDDTNGTGSFENPFATIEKAVEAINSLANSENDYAIVIIGTVVGSNKINNALSAASLLIRGNTGSDVDVLDGGGVDNVLVIKTSVAVTIKNLTLKNGLATTTGGGGLSLTNGADVTLESGTVITENRAELKDASNPKNGGGVFVNPGAKLTMNDGALITNNTTYGAGGGVNLDKDGATFIMNGGTISGNVAGIVNADGSITGFIASGETEVKGGNGGGVRFGENAVFTMNGGSITGNKAYKNGAGIFSKGILSIYGGTITGNIRILPTDNIGISSEGEFHIGKAAKIGTDNLVFLGDSATITIDSALSASSVAKIKPKNRTDGTVILSGSAGLIAENYSKFALDSSFAAGWYIDSSGILREPGATMTISVTLPTYSEISVKYTKVGNEIRFEVDTTNGEYSTYTWSFDGTESGSSSLFTKDLTGWQAGVYDLYLEAMKGAAVYSYYAAVKVE